MRTAVLTISTSLAAGDGEDLSGPRLATLAQGAGCEIVHREVLPDDRAAIARRLRELVAAGHAVVLTTGGTGFTPDDHTPEATLDVIEREAPGIAEALRTEGLKHKPHAMLTRGVAGLAGGTLIVNFPGNPKALDETFGVLAAVLPHAVKTLRRADGQRTGH
ncbi:MAG: molybdenum cofactor synthesis domain protein [Solirubrobacterales bacterium]|jgi:molybdenum cofactor synthesis domain-containing protein|nr:molybdenum cofactor synthesis domain protein [Solirubrobacterales bacterium]